MTQTAHVVSHTHWDREWYRPYQVFRARLIEAIDAVLDLLERRPDYRFFHLDGQTIVLDDYLEIRPEKEPLLRKFIQEGRLLVGPWYTQPDEFLVSGEAMVRNLLMGGRAAEAMGGCMALGYQPDSFGHASQMPQIYAGFGFPAAVLFRGITADQVRSVFKWVGADGTALPTIKMPDDDAYSNYLYRLRETLADSKPLNTDRLDGELARLRDETESMAVCDHLLWMDGVDHIFPNPKTPDIIRYANQTLAGMNVIHSTLPEYVRQVLLAAPELTEQAGELRHANRQWRLQAVLANVASSHIGIKQANFSAQVALERIVEPLCSMAWLRGAEYPYRHLQVAWKLLLQNHAHDSICGCSVDRVHRDMHYRFAQIFDIADVIKTRALKALADQVDTAAAQPNQQVLLVFNPLPWQRRETIVVDAPMPAGTRGDLLTTTIAGEGVASQALGIHESGRLQQPRYDIPSMDNRRNYRLALNAQMPAYGFAAFCVSPSDTPQRPQGTLFTGMRTMENRLLSVTVEDDGAITLTAKQSGKVYRGLLAFEDCGDGGEGWNWIPPRFDRVYTSRGASVEVSREHDGPLLASLRLRMKFRVPAGFVGVPYEHDPARMQRSNELVDMPIDALLTLGAESRRLDIALTVDNPARNHRLRVLFPTNIATDHCFADGAFDVIRRSIAQPDSHDWREPQLGTYPHSSFVCVEDADCGLAILTAGTPEYEVVDDASRTVAITLLRAFGRGAGEPHEYVDSQEPGLHTYRLAVLPYAGRWEDDDVMRESRAFAVPLLPVLTTRHAGIIPVDHSLLQIEGDGIDVTAIKRCEERNSMLVRMVNLSSDSQPITLNAGVPCVHAYELDLAEKRHQPLQLDADGSLRVMLRPRQIVTLELVPGT
ncbi:MAG: glycosyl hydrolase-related protein [Chloroflexi bacterium]|nr:glycosyl hydrolase-related protein [Chloroflexota bacterium]MCL5273593.1 glycosyl hydrolase-related protein [Chloroflexota bacterium]